MADNNVTLAKTQLLNFHISLGTQEDLSIEMTLLTSHTTVPASVLPTGRHLLLGNTQAVKSGWHSDTAHLRGSSLLFFFQWALHISVSSSPLNLLNTPAITSDSVTHLNQYSFKYLFTSEYYLNN